MTNFGSFSMNKLLPLGLALLITLLFIDSSSADCRYNRGHVFAKGSQCQASFGWLKWQGDGNLVIYDNANGAKWSTHTQGAGDRLIFQLDGNLVIYNSQNVAIWNSGTPGRGRTLKFQDDRNFVIYNDKNKPIWKTNTQERRSG